MTLYLDAGAILRLYLDDAEAPAVRRRAADATAIATARTAYAEVTAALAEAERGGRLSAHARAACVAAFREDWPHYVLVAVTQGIVEGAADACERYDLSPAEALHIAAAAALAAGLRYEATFLAVDPRVMAAAKAEGLVLDGTDGHTRRSAPVSRPPWAQALLPEPPGHA